MAKIPKTERSRTQKGTGSAAARESKSVEETAEIAENFLARLVNSENDKSAALVVGLSGNLGAGKTALVKAIAKHLKIKDKISSPTFVIMKRYPVSPEAWRRFGSPAAYTSLYHLDAYRLKNEQELLSLGWSEVVKNPGHIVFVEWPENVRKAMPPSSKNIRISHEEEGKRIFRLEPGGTRRKRHSRG